MDKHIKVTGHSFVAKPNRFGTTHKCECGKELGWSHTPIKTARYIHTDHKKSVLRELAAH